MHWLDPVNAVIEAQAAKVHPAALSRSAERLSNFYRGERLGRGNLESDPLFPLAYAVTRLPATAAAIEFTFREIRRRMPDLEVESLLDLGAGPGTSLMPLLLHWPGAGRATLIEPHAGFAVLGALTASQVQATGTITQEWRRARLPLTGPPEAHDAVLISYALHEFGEDSRAQTLDHAWKAARKLLVVIEPGTPAGFDSLLHARDQLLALGAHVLAPCPGEMQCPLREAPNRWCHFSVRLPRTRRHRRAKGGELGWEDEKFCYCVFARTSPVERPARIIGRPAAKKPGLELELCSASGLQRTLIGRKDPNYPLARRAKWGDGWQNTHRA